MYPISLKSPEISRENQAVVYCFYSYQFCVLLEFLPES
jgi:hypothetical protein